MKSTAIGLIAIGFLLLVSGALWAKMFPPTSSWTPEKAERLSHVKEQLNNLSFKLFNAQGRTYGGEDPGALKSQHDTLLNEFGELKTDFESATETPQTVARILKWTGISLTLGGIAAFYAANQSQ